MDEGFLAFLADDLLSVVGGTTDFAHTKTGAVGVGKDADDIVGFERAFDAGDSYGEDGGRLLSEEGTYGTFVKVDGSF